MSENLTPEQIPELLGRFRSRKMLLMAHVRPDGDAIGSLCAAMLLSIAGVAREDICADYSMSMAYLGRRYQAMTKWLPVTLDKDGLPELGSGFFSTMPTFMRRTLDYLNRTYGGMVPYLRACGVSEETMLRIRNKFVEY